MVQKFSKGVDQGNDPIKLFRFTIEGGDDLATADLQQTQPLRCWRRPFPIVIRVFLIRESPCEVRPANRKKMLMISRYHARIAFMIPISHVHPVSLMIMILAIPTNRGKAQLQLFPINRPMRSVTCSMTLSHNPNMNQARVHPVHSENTVFRASTTQHQNI